MEYTVNNLKEIADAQSTEYPISYDLLHEFIGKIDNFDCVEFLSDCFKHLDLQFSEIIAIYLFDKAQKLSFEDWIELMRKNREPVSLFSIVNVLWKYFNINAVEVLFESKILSTKDQTKTIEYIWLNKLKLNFKYLDKDDVEKIEHLHNIKFDFSAYSQSLIAQGAPGLPKSKNERSEIIRYWRSTIAKNFDGDDNEA